MGDDAADDSLDAYRKRRRFDQTPEPPAARGSSESGRSFVVQKHEARRLHYDLRLELDGALLSWAVPKGPSLSPAERRLAVRTEDHPIAYGSFEGVIPDGQYGAGTVMVWDRGRWAPDGDPKAALDAGHLRFSLDGEKMRGRWHLVRTGRDSKRWLLIKGGDAEADEDDPARLIRERPRSVLSDRGMDAIARYLRGELDRELRDAA